jgi:hypothetical protein
MPTLDLTGSDWEGLELGKSIAHRYPRLVNRTTKILAGLLLMGLAPEVLAAEHPTEVVVLCTLHQMHEEVPSYSYAALGNAIEHLHPDVLVVELTPADLAARGEQKNKREYQNSVYPLLKQHKWTVVAMEPEGSRRAELLADIREADQTLERDSPQKVEAFQTYVENLFAYLQSRWQSAADVNSAWTDDLFAVKHRFQNSLFGAKEEEGWEGWNRYFLDQVVAAASANPGKRVLVLVGVEHGYWLRSHLRQTPAIELLDSPAQLR